MARIACAASSSVVKPRGHEAMRQRGLVDDADRPAVGLEPDGAHGFAVDLHGDSLARLRPGGEPVPMRGLPAQRACRNVARKVSGDADGRRRLRSRVQSTRPRAGASGDFCPLGARRRGLSRRDAQERARRARPLLRRHAAADHRPVPAGGAGNDAPLALFIHGGYWRSMDPSLFSHMARGLNGRGLAVAVIGLRSVPERHHRRHHRAGPARVRLPVAALRPKMLVCGAFGRRPSHRRHGRHRLATRSIRRRRPISRRSGTRFPACSISPRSSA